MWESSRPSCHRQGGGAKVGDRSSRSAKGGKKNWPPGQGPVGKGMRNGKKAGGKGNSLLEKKELMAEKTTSNRGRSEALKCDLMRRGGFAGLLSREYTEGAKDRRSREEKVRVPFKTQKKEMLPWNVATEKAPEARFGKRNT